MLRAKVGAVVFGATVIVGTTVVFGTAVVGALVVVGMSVVGAIVVGRLVVGGAVCEDTLHTVANGQVRAVLQPPLLSMIMQPRCPSRPFGKLLKSKLVPSIQLPESIPNVVYDAVT